MKQQVKYLDLAAQFNSQELIGELRRVFASGFFVLGPEVEAFERDFANLCDVAFAVGVNSATDALFLALKALGIGSGDEVITAPNSFVATAGAIVAAGAKPVFVDVGSDYNLDPNLLPAAIGKRTKAVIPVHLSGYPADMERIMTIAERQGLYVIEDAAQAVGAAIDGRPVGSFGHIACFSLHPLKNLNVCGDGGVLTTRDEKVATKLRLLRNHGLKNRDEIEFFGYNSRLDTLQAVTAGWVMRHLPAITEKRRKWAGIYDRQLSGMSGCITLPERRPERRHVFHTYVIQTERRTELAAYLLEQGIETKIHYPVPIHLQKPCRQLGYSRGDFPVCEAQSEKILSLPVHQHLTETQIHYTVGKIKDFYQKG